MKMCLYVYNLYVGVGIHIAHVSRDSREPYLCLLATNTMRVLSCCTHTCTSNMIVPAQNTFILARLMLAYQIEHGSTARLCLRFHRTMVSSIPRTRKIMVLDLQPYILQAQEENGSCHTDMCSWN